MAKKKKPEECKHSYWFQFSLVLVPGERDLVRSCENYGAVLSLHSVSLHRIAASLYAIRVAGAARVAVRNSGRVVVSGSFSLRTARSERDSCESYEHENEFLHFDVRLK